MSWKASVVRGAAVGWAILLLAVFVVFAGVSVLMPSTKSSRIRFDNAEERAHAPGAAVEAPGAQPATQPAQ